MNRLLEE